jgi:hypothetical protein
MSSVVSKDKHKYEDNCSMNTKKMRIANKSNNADHNSRIKFKLESKKIFQMKLALKNKIRNSKKRKKREVDNLCNRTN